MKDSVDFDLYYASNFDVLKRLSESLAKTVTEAIRERDPKGPTVTINLILIRDRHMGPDADVVFWRVGVE